jgi:hypothetical protein
MFLLLRNVGGEVRVGIFAKRDIKAGEEMKIDYNFERVFGSKKQQCFCGARYDTNHALLCLLVFFFFVFVFFGGDLLCPHQSCCAALCVDQEYISGLREWD